MKGRTSFPHLFPTLAVGLCFISIATANTTLAQIIPDDTLGNESSQVNSLNSNTQQIDGGAIRGSNLFHSFQEFNVNEGQTVNFSNPEGIAHIFSRVTGNNLSEILGTLGVLGNADFFLLNPNGIIFGPNSSLNLNGSFLATSASSIHFADGNKFATTNISNKPLLTISTPIGLGFEVEGRRGSPAMSNRLVEQPPGTIVNQSVADDVGLQVPSGENLVLIGGNITLEGGRITASEGEGKIELGSVAGNSVNSVVNLKLANSSFDVEYDEVTDFSSIVLTQGAKINTSEASINLQGNQISLVNGSQIASQVSGSQSGGDVMVKARQLFINNKANILTATFGEGDAGNINIDVSESIEIVGTGFEEFEQVFIQRSINIDNPLDIDTISNAGTGILTETNAKGAAGDVTINTSLLQLQEGGVITGYTFAEGDIGSFNINTIDSIEVIGSGIFNSPLLGSTGEGNMLEINTKNLTVRDGGIISSVTLGTGNGGNININASEQINIINATGIVTNSIFGSGEAGDITMTTKKLNIQDGGQVVSASGALFFNTASEKLDIISEGGIGGDIKVTSSESIEISGSLSVISSNTFTKNDAGNLDIKTSNLIISNGALIDASTINSGNAGDVTINASESITISGTYFTNNRFSSSISSTSGELPPNINFDSTLATGDAGSLSINTENLLILDGAKVSVNSVASGNAGTLEIIADSIRLDNGATITASTFSGDKGNINLQTEELLLFRNSTIRTDAQNSDGGNITIDTDLIFAFPNQNSDIIASALQGGNGGNITINSEVILGIEERSSMPPNKTNDIDASSQFGLDGTVAITNPDTSISRTLIDATPDVIDANNIFTNNYCKINQNSKYIVTGRGGLPLAPEREILPEYTWEDWRVIEQDTSANNPTVSNNNISLPSPKNSSHPQRTSPDFEVSSKSVSSKINPIQGWMVNQQGQIVLTANPIMVTPHAATTKTPGCS